jgi:DNA-binding Xre family transcriptional regulator
MKNNIKALLEERDISINKFATDLGMYYKTAHELVNREDLSDTKVGTLQKVAEYLKVKIEDLYK